MRGTRASYRQAHPHPPDIGLVVEVADTSLAVDRLKGITYGATGIPAYWIVNLVERCVEVFGVADPTSEAGYATNEIVRIDGSIPVRIESRLVGSIAVAAILP